MINRGIPTTYGGVRYRSRLEARWAAFFDLVKWPFAYEPIDLDNYIPDFVLTFDAGHIGVEVKPATELPELRAHAQRIAHAGWTKELVAVGAAHWSNVVGLIGERDDGEVIVNSAEVFRCISCGRLSLLSSEGSWRCRLCGVSEHHVGGLEPGELAGYWAAAGNRVQWKAPEAAE